MHAINGWRSEASPRAKDLAALRLALARIEARREGGSRTASREPFSLGAAEVDAVLGGGLNRACLHEVLAPRGADWSAAAGFGLALALRAARGRPLLWARQDFLDGETGRLILLSALSGNRRNWRKSMPMFPPLPRKTAFDLTRKHFGLCEGQDRPWTFYD